MKNLTRDNPLFSLCGLNCCLCTLYLGGHCPGCGGGEGNQSCAIGRCGQRRGGVEYCWLCQDFPCDRYANFAPYDSIVVCRHREQDINRAREIGIDAYLAELKEKTEALDLLLAHYNDGRKKTFYICAMSLLPVDDIRAVLAKLAAGETSGDVKERAAQAGWLFQSVAARLGIELKFHKKPKTPQ